jgi:hypothetical protein
MGRARRAALAAGEKGIDLASNGYDNPRNTYNSTRNLPLPESNHGVAPDAMGFTSRDSGIGLACKPNCRA